MRIVRETRHDLLKVTETVSVKTRKINVGGSGHFGRR